MELIPILFIWLIGTILVGVIADKKGRSVLGWVVLSLFISPLIAIIIVAIIGESNENRMKRIIEEEKIREAIRRGEDVSKMNFSDEPVAVREKTVLSKTPDLWIPILIIGILLLLTVVIPIILASI